MVISNPTRANNVQIKKRRHMRTLRLMTQRHVMATTRGPYKEIIT